MDERVTVGFVPGPWNCRRNHREVNISVDFRRIRRNLTVEKARYSRQRARPVRRSQAMQVLRFVWEM